MFTKTQLKIMEVFAANITERFSIRKVSQILKKPYPLIHRSMGGLIKDGFVNKDKQNFLSLNCKQHHSVLAYTESIRKEGFIEKNRTISLFAKDVLERIKRDFFIFLIFGSCVNNKPNPRDVDVLFILEDTDQIASAEKALHNIASNFSLDFHITVISAESAHEMLVRREEANLMNETLNNHIILFGAENYYRLIKNA